MSFLSLKKLKKKEERGKGKNGFKRFRRHRILQKRPCYLLPLLQVELRIPPKGYVIDPPFLFI